MRHERTRSVGVLGGGIAGLAAAIAFRRALPEAGVTLFGAGGEPEYPGAAGASIHEFHRLVGIDPQLFRRRTGAVTVREAEIRRADRLAFRFVPLAEIPHVDGAALHQLWLRWTGSNLGTGTAWADVARRASRSDDLAGGLGERFHAAAYLALLGELAGHLGVQAAGEAPDSAELAGTLDLVIDTRAKDASEPGWLRIEGIPGACGWTGEAGARPAGAGVETIELTSAGVRWDAGPWRMAAPLDRSPFAAGRASAPWQGNVLAMGRAAVQCETFDGQPLSVALAGVARALELLPRPGASGRETAEYNRRSGAVHDWLLDWAAERWGAGKVVPAGLAALREQFEHRGRIPFRDEDPVPAGHWIGWLLGRGVRPRHVDLTAMALPDERMAAIFASL